MNSVIDTLIFDLDETLVVEEASAAAAFIETGELARARYGLDPDELHRTVRQTCRELWYAFSSHPYCKRVGISSWEGMWAEFSGSARDLKALHHWAPDYRYNSWRTALLRHGIDDPDLAAELADTFPRLRQTKNVVHQDAVPVLERLSPKYCLGLLTNGTPDLQRRKLNGAGLAGYFNRVLIAGEVGIGKPDPRLFMILLAALKAKAGTTLMIGDNLNSDVHGAQNAGMRAVWINRTGQTCHDGIVPDWEISSLYELDAVLGAVQ